ncbi:putative F-box/FBD/LRR-repeat protein At5g22670 [Argentina anserina]|uniref:putative F-box/FBD/LRR-repeat protein At5g22670 n=1 Tax=Argentina anserina TaxID=57926 RepID=UPI0021765C0B|nr:putative F-box/FBD/LRR-repeat protein At5g22670 [Potentilla anserina]
MKRNGPTFQSVEHQVENKGKRRRKSREGYHNLDRISALPDDILVYLVSHLPLKEAVATSVLSRRWHNVGLSTTTLRFHVVDFSICDNFRRYWRFQTKEFIEQENWKYINWVDHVLQQHKGKHVKEFRVSFSLDGRFSSSINRWIQFAMENSVERLELDLYPEAFLRFGYEDYKLHKLLGLCIPNLGSCGGNIGFKSLKVLQIRHVGVTGEFLEHFLSSCPLLERLSVSYSKDLVNLRVISPSIALKYLVIRNCDNLESIEIRDVNIVSFSYRGFRSTNLVISNVPLLSEVTFLKNAWPKDFIRDIFTHCCLSNIENLKLHIHGAAYNEKSALPLLANLKHLELYVVANYRRALHHLNSFLKASPYLLTLVLKLDKYEGRPLYSCLEVGEIEKAPDCPHNHLKVVEILGYRAHTSGVEHVMYLLKNVLALEKIVVDPVRGWGYPRGLDRPDTEVDEEVKARDHAEQYLKPKIPATVEFVCM